MFNMMPWKRAMFPVFFFFHGKATDITFRQCVNVLSSFKTRVNFWCFYSVHKKYIVKAVDFLLSFKTKKQKVVADILSNGKSTFQRGQNNSILCAFVVLFCFSASPCLGKLFLCQVADFLKRSHCLSSLCFFFRARKQLFSSRKT